MLVVDCIELLTTSVVIDLEFTTISSSLLDLMDLLFLFFVFVVAVVFCVHYFAGSLFLICVFCLVCGLELSGCCVV